jgi:hypothetical protein
MRTGKALSDFGTKFLIALLAGFVLAVAPGVGHVAAQTAMPPVGIGGWVMDDGGHGLPGCIQVWDSYPDGAIVAETCAGPDGYFVVAVDVGIYDVRVVEKGYCTVVEQGVESPSTNLVLSMTSVPAPFITPFVADFWGVDATLFGLPLQPGDVITATDPDGVLCGVATVATAGQFLIHVYGDDQMTTPGIDEGAVGGDEITFWLNCACPLTARQVWTQHASLNEHLAFECTREQKIPLCGDWSLISYNVIADDSTLENVLLSIDGLYRHVITSTCEDGALTWDIDRPSHLDDLHFMDNFHGYLIYAPNADTLAMTGVPMAPDTPIELCGGWNLISYLPDEADSLLRAFSSISGDFEYVYGFDCDLGAQTYDPLRPAILNDLTCMKPGHGYWVWMTDAATLTDPAAGYTCGSTINSSPRIVNLIDGITPTPWVCDFWSAGSPDGPAPGSVLTVHDEQGTKCGQAVVLDGGAFMVHVYGDNPLTAADEGAVDGSHLTFASNGELVSSNATATWNERGSVEITLSGSGGSAPVPQTFELSQNYPNPFNAGTTIRFVLPPSVEWQLCIYNIVGQEIARFGGHGVGEPLSVYWDGVDAPSGIYFYRLTTDGFCETRKMILLK